MLAASFESVATLIGWMLLHSLWQGALVGLAYAGLRPLFARGESRYRLGLAMLVLMLVGQWLTLWVMLHAPIAVAADPRAWAEVSVLPPLAAVDASRACAFKGALAWLAALWALGVGAHLLRAACAWRKLAMAVRQAEAVPVWQQRVKALARRFGVRLPVRVLRANLAGGPLVVGLLRPVILLPAAVACQLPLAQVELILAHELAHLRRLDPWANLFQLVLETLYFHHPAIRWLARELRNEREVCCDALVLSTMGGPRQAYAGALAALAEMQLRPNPLALASTGGKLLERIQLIAMHAPRSADTRRNFTPLAVWLGLVTALLLAGQAWQRRQPTGDMPAWSLSMPAFGVDAWSLPMAMTLPLQRPLLRLARVHARAAVDDDAGNQPASAVLPWRRAVAIAHPVWHASSLSLPDIARPVVAAMPRLLGMATQSPAPVAALPVPLHRQAPVYPQRALMQGIEGRVVLEFALDGQGRVRDIHVLRSQPAGMFDDAAIQALDQWTFAVPAAAGPRRFTQALDFRLPGAAKSADDEGMRARFPCVVPTGTHVCRPL